MSAQLYIDIYFNLLLLITIVVSLKYIIDNKIFDRRVAIVTFLLVFLHITFRQLDPLFGDTRTYARYLAEAAMGFGVDLEGKDIGFQYFTYLCRSLDVTTFFGIICLIYIVPVFYALKKRFPNNYGAAFLMFVGSFSFWGYGVNGLRNGMATSLVILAVMCFDRLWVKALILIVAISFHKSVLLPCVAYMLTFFIKKTKSYYYIWLLFFVISLLGRSTVGNLIGNIGLFSVDERMLDYANGTFGTGGITFSSTGYRWDFLLYSIVPMVVGYYYVIKKKYSDALFIRLLQMYIVCNAFWLLTVYVPFNNRFAYLSWFLFPIVIIYPLIEGDILNKPRTLTNRHIRQALFLNYLFTYMMRLF